jgi:transposase
LPFIRETLEKFPTLTASRLYAMVKSRGYSGSPDHFRHLIALHRPRPKAEAYLRLRTLPGEQAQVDWGLCRARHKPHYAELWTMPSKC